MAVVVLWINRMTFFVLLFLYLYREDSLFYLILWQQHLAVEAEPLVVIYYWNSSYSF